MSGTVQTQTQRVIPIRALTNEDKVLMAISSVLMGGMASLAAVCGFLDAWAILVIGPIVVAGPSHIASINLKQGPLLEWNKPANMKTSVFSFFGKRKSYPIRKMNAQGRIIDGEYIIGRGSAYIKETVQFEPLDVWDSSMNAVRTVYSLERASMKEMKAVELGPDDSVEYGSDQHAFATSDTRSRLIERYEKEIRELKSMSPCPQAALKAKQERLQRIQTTLHMYS